MRPAVFLTLLALSASLVLLGGLACNELTGLLGAAGGTKVQCHLSGTAVGFDGGEVKKLDVNWYPDESAGTSDTIEGEVDGSTFNVTALTLPQGANRAVGQLAIGEAPTPPLPANYGQVRIDIDLPIDNCEMDLGEVVLPARGSSDDQTGEPVNNGEGTNNGGTNNAVDADAGTDDVGTDDAADADAG